MILSKMRLSMLTIILMFMLLPAAASANGGPLLDPATGYGLLRFDEKSNISLVREKVAYTVKKGGNRYQDDGEVTVHYELHNRNDVQKDIEVLFLTPSIEGLTVMEGDKTIKSSPAGNEKPFNWRPLAKNSVTDPLSGKELSLSHASDYNRAQGTRFPLSFEPNETKHIVVQYVEPGGMYDKGVINIIYSHLYYLTPASYWEGKPQVELEVKLYAPGGKLHSNLRLEKISPTTFKAVFNELPSEDWYFSYTYPKRLLFSTNVEKDHNGLVLGTAAALTVIAAALALIFRRSFIFTVSALGIWFFTIYYISKMGGYPFNFILVVFTDIVVGMSLVLCNVVVWKINRKRLKAEK
ncbi:hypothetical protein [Paenibacillus sp. PL91]|uniref:hypothetical protein n=1 Tax=Paenibacillus sp. PL91 TaxID=2729538 RepID=UPI00145CBE6F|nr:hypothetical protein [Paenibacillus sp. PL91]MBC9202046.1 hypothetical protein [Paenibacillus sp. PL91]